MRKTASLLLLLVILWNSLPVQASSIDSNSNDLCMCLEYSDKAETAFSENEFILKTLYESFVVAEYDPSQEAYIYVGETDDFESATVLYTHADATPANILRIYNLPTGTYDMTMIKVASDYKIIQEQIRFHFTPDGFWLNGNKVNDEENEITLVILSKSYKLPNVCSCENSNLMVYIGFGFIWLGSCMLLFFLWKRSKEDAGIQKAERILEELDKNSETSHGKE